MAQRDEGLDKLEAFISAAAQTRATLQREAGRLKEVSGQLGDELDHVEARLEELDAAIEAFDARHGETVEIVLAIAMAIAIGVLIGGLPGVLAIIVLLPLTYWVSHRLRGHVGEIGDEAIDAYRALSEATRRVEALLASAGEAAEAAWTEFLEVEDSVRDALVEPWLPVLEELGPALQTHFTEH